MVYSWRPGFLRMDDEQSDHPHHFLHGSVGVVKKCSCLIQRELVGKVIAGRNWFLADVRWAVHLNRNFKAVPVDRGRFRKVVLENDPDAVTLIDLYRRARARTVVTPHFHVSPRNQPAYN